jgi:hypothetical protein
MTDGTPAAILAVAGCRGATCAADRSFRPVAMCQMIFPFVPFSALQRSMHALV